MAVNCAHCKYWQPEYAYGKCKRYGPLAARSADEGTVSFWATTLWSDWCGDFEVRKAGPHYTPPAATQQSDDQGTA